MQENKNYELDQESESDPMMLLNKANISALKFLEEIVSDPSQDSEARMRAAQMIMSRRFKKKSYAPNKN